MSCRCIHCVTIGSLDQYSQYEDYLDDDEQGVALSTGVDKTEMLGLLILDGYTWGTQPGDPDDERTYCSTSDGKVSPRAEECKTARGNKFQLVKSKVKGMNFKICQGGNISAKGENGENLEAELKDAMLKLLKIDEVKVITANCGFFMQFQTNVLDMIENDKELQKWICFDYYKNSKTKVINDPKTCVRKQVKLSSLALIQPIMNMKNKGGWGLREIHEQSEDSKLGAFTLLVTTANDESLTPDAVRRINADIDTKAKIVDTKRNNVVEPKGQWKFSWADVAATVNKARQMITKSIFGGNIEDEGNIAIQGIQTTKWLGKAIGAGVAWNAPMSGQFEVPLIADKIREVEGKRNDTSDPPHKAANNRVVRMILQECTELPGTSAMLRLSFGLPVVDFTDLAYCLMAWAMDKGEVISGTDCTNFPAKEKDVLCSTTFKKCIMDRSVAYASGLSDARNTNSRQTKNRWGVQLTPGYTATNRNVTDLANSFEPEPGTVRNVSQYDEGGDDPKCLLASASLKTYKDCPSIKSLCDDGKLKNDARRCCPVTCLHAMQGDSADALAAANAR